jgi:hypothetical protein
MRAGERVTLTADVDTALTPGRYSALCSISRSGSPGDDVLHDVRIAEFLVKGPDPIPGMVVVDANITATVERG